jgi:hypothetical protein
MRQRNCLHLISIFENGSRLALRLRFAASSEFCHGRTASEAPRDPAIHGFPARARVARWPGMT